MKSIHLLFLASAVFALAACRSEGTAGETPENAAGEEPGIRLNAEQEAMAKIELGHPQMRELARTIECAGRVDVPPQNRAVVHAPVTAFVRRVRYLPGDYVKKGTPLLTIEHPELVRLQRTFLEEVALLKGLKKDYQRKSGLVGTDATSERALDEVQARYQASKARCNGLRAELELLGMDPAKLEADGAIQTQLSLRAPVSGYIQAVNVALGQLVQPETPLYTIVDPGHAHLELDVFAKDLPFVRKGQPVLSFLPGERDTFPAVVFLVGAMVDPKDKTAMIHGHFKKEPVSLAPGTYLRAHILADAREALSLPESALVRDGQRVLVFRKKGEVFTPVAVETGRREGEFVEILGHALAPTDTVVLRGGYYLKE